MTDAVLSQIEQIIRGIETRTPHSDDCAIWGGVNPEGPCDCDVTPRRRTEIARTVERMLRHAVDSTFTSCAVLGSTASMETFHKAVAASVRAAGGTPQ